MIKFEFNGAPFNARTFEETILKAAMEAVAEQLRKKVGAIRHPETGEFPTIVVSATSLEDMKLRVEGSPELLALVNERLELTNSDAPDDSISPLDRPAPIVFMSYASEDRALADKVANALQSSGIETWWADWCISAGDSIRQKIDEGLGKCTHFVVLLTPVALTKPWVNHEIDAALMLKLSSKEVKLIPLRHRLDAKNLPPTLLCISSPEIENPEQDVGQLINDIHGVTKKPALGMAPWVVAESDARSTGYSAAANAIAKVFVETTHNACLFDPQLSMAELMEKTGLSRDDVADAAHELDGMVTVHFEETVWPQDELFATFDRFWKPWNPGEDALKLAADMLNDEEFPTAPREIGQRYGWEPRRLNPAMAYLINRKVVRDLNATGSGPWLTVLIQKTDATRRFVKSRS